MAEGSITLPTATGSVTGRRLLFPVMPAPGETLPGYLLRNVEPNFLSNIRPLLSVAGVDVALAGNCIDKLSRVAGRLYDSFGVPKDAWNELWGVERERGGRRRLGGVWLTPDQVESGRRRVPPSHVPGAPDKAIWMVRDLGFCPTSWEMLIDRCPRPTCNLLTWMSATALHVCGYCKTPVSAQKRRTVPKAFRPELSWLVGLFGDDAEQERSMKALPPLFGAETPTDAYELVLGIARPLRVARDPSILGRVNLDLLDIARACRYLLDHPRSHWDLHQQADDVVSAFRARLETQLRLSQRPVVRSDLVRVLQYGWPGKSKVDPVWEAEWVSVTEAAAILRLERRKVRSLIDAGFLHEDSKLGGQHRMHSSLRRVNVDRLRGELMAQMPLREFQSQTGLNRSAVDQLLGLGLLAETTSAAAKLVYQGLHIERESAEALLEGLAVAPEVDPCEGGVPIWEVMRGVGGRPKPWARLLRAALDGKLPGGLRGAPGSKITDRTLHPVTARHLVMGGIDAGHPFEFHAGDLGQWERPDMTTSEVEEFLNCTAQDVCWLRQRKYLQSLSAKGEVAQYDRHEVEALGRRMITTREIAARIGKPPAKLWPELQAFSVGGSLGQGFYERALIEPWMALA